MKTAAINAIVVFLVVFAVLSLVEWLIHRLRHNPDKNYRWGVWVFSILLGAYAFINGLGH